jgi:hypothetical protein
MSHDGHIPSNARTLLGVFWLASSVERFGRCTLLESRLEDQLSCQAFLGFLQLLSCGHRNKSYVSVLVGGFLD